MGLGTGQVLFHKWPSIGMKSYNTTYRQKTEIFSPVFSFSGGQYCRVTSLRIGGRCKSYFGRLQNVHHYWCFSLAHSDLSFVHLSKIVSTELANNLSKFYQKLWMPCVMEERQDSELDQSFQFVDKYTAIRRNVNKLHG